MLKIYLAGASKELERCGRIMDALIAMPSVHVTHNWVGDLRRVRASGVMTDAELSPAEARTHADADRRGIRDAHIFWQLVPAAGVYTHGAFWELGYAQCLSDIWDSDRMIILSREAGASPGLSIFHHLTSDCKFRDVDSDERTLEWIESEAA